MAGVIVPTPNRYGIIEDYTGLADMVHEAKALLGINADPSALAVLRTPPRGVDKACGDGQTLGMPCSSEVRISDTSHAPTRCSAKCPDAWWVLLSMHPESVAMYLPSQAREQHIRREKATSTSAPNQSLMAPIRHNLRGAHRQRRTA